MHVLTYAFIAVELDKHAGVAPPQMFVPLSSYHSKVTHYKSVTAAGRVTTPKGDYTHKHNHRTRADRLMYAFRALDLTERNTGVYIDTIGF